MGFANQAVAGLQRQRCKACWHDDGLDFNVPAEVWAAVVPEELQKKVVCLRCFDLFAAEKGMEYQDHLAAEIYFAGEQAALVFRIDRRVRSSSR